MHYIWKTRHTHCDIVVVVDEVHVEVMLIYALILCIMLSNASCFYLYFEFAKYKPTKTSNET